MNEYSYNVKVWEKTKEEAERKMKAITMLMKKLSSKELEKLADIVENDPIKTALAKKALGM